MSLAWEGFSQRYSRITTVVVQFLEVHRMAAVSARSNFYLYGYTDQNVAGDDRYYRDVARGYREIDWQGS